MKSERRRGKIKIKIPPDPTWICDTAAPIQKMPLVIVPSAEEMEKPKVIFEQEEARIRARQSKGKFPSISSLLIMAVTVSRVSPPKIPWVEQEIPNHVLIVFAIVSSTFTTNTITS